MAASGSGLMERIQRMVDRPKEDGSFQSWAGIAITIGACLFLFGSISFAEPKPDEQEAKVKAPEKTGESAVAEKSADTEEELDTANAEEKKGPPAWFPGETKGKEREIALKILGKPNDEVKHLAFASLVGRWIETDPDEALKFDKELKDPHEQQTFFFAAAPSLSRKRPELVMSEVLRGRWWPDQYNHVAVAMRHLSQKDLDAAIDVFTKAPEKVQQFLTGRNLARMIAERDGPAAGLEFAEGVENRGGREGAVRGAMHSWVQSDEAAAVAYTEDLENFSEKNIAILGMVAGKGRTNDPQKALEWVKTLGDDKMRRMALVNLVWLWSLEGKDAEMDRILGDKTIPMDDRNAMEAQLKRMDIRTTVLP